MYFLLSVNRNSMAEHLTGSDRRVLRSDVYPMQWVGHDGDMLWNGSEEDGNVRSGCEGDEGSNCEDGDSDPN